MAVRLQWIVGNQYAAYLLNEDEELEVFIGYHYTSENCSKDDIARRLQRDISRFMELVHEES